MKPDKYSIKTFKSKPQVMHGNSVISLPDGSVIACKWTAIPCGDDNLIVLDKSQSRRYKRKP